MKLLYFCIQMDQVGGVAKIESEKINWLVNHNYEVTMCDIENWPIKPAYPLDNRVKILQGDISTTPGVFFTRLKGVFKAIGRTREIIKEENPDIIVNAHCPLVTWIIPWVCGKIPTIAEMHLSKQGLEVFDRKYMSRLGMWLHLKSTHWIYGKYNRFICLTTEDAGAWKLENVQVIPNFSGISKMNTLSKSKQLEHQIIMLARLSLHKRVDLMIEIWNRLHSDFPDWHVKVLGDGVEREPLERKIEELGVKDSFLMPGCVSDVKEELQNSDILCLTSESEGFGIVLIEAMMLRVPVMAFEYVGVHDIIENGKDGIIVPFGNVEQYVSHLRDLINNTEERERLANNALKSVKKFDKEQVMQQWVCLFDNLCNSQL